MHRTRRQASHHWKLPRQSALDFDVLLLDASEISDDPMDLVALGVSRAIVMRGAGIDFCALGMNEVPKQVEIGR